MHSKLMYRAPKNGISIFGLGEIVLNGRMTLHTTILDTCSYGIAHHRFLSRHRSAETQCWMRCVGTWYVRTWYVRVRTWYVRVRTWYVRVRTSIFAMRPRKCCMHALHPYRVSNVLIACK